MTNPTTIQIGGRAIGSQESVFVIAEVSANHGGHLDGAKALVAAAAAAGADAVKFQTYTPDTMTLNSDSEWFTVGKGTIWEGRTLHDLYAEAMTPWEWHEELAKAADREGMLWFSSPFDATAVDFLEKLDPPAYKIASFELVDLPLIRKVAATGRPMVMSTGMATAAEIAEAVDTAREAGAREIALMRCNSAYPAPLDEMDLLTIPDMAERWNVPVGLSDHTLGSTAATVAVALGARLLEKHIILSRADGGPDAEFSAEPEEFRQLVAAVREAERLVGKVRYGPSKAEVPSLQFRRSLWIVEPVRAGAQFTPENVRVLRPGPGLPPREYDNVMGRRAARDAARGTPLTDDLIS